MPHAVTTLEHARWGVRVAAARLLAVSGGRDALPALQDAVTREEVPVAPEVLEQAVSTLVGRA